MNYWDGTRGTLRQARTTMFIDSRTLPDRPRHYDVCIVGAGAAGITLARTLQSSRRSVCLLEAGGLDYDAGTQDLYQGQTRGAGLDPEHYLTDSRLRFFGGTTNHWMGWCRPLDAMDFAPRPWIRHSGWPIDRATLEPYYRRAQPIVQIDPFDETWDEITMPGTSIVPPDGAVMAKVFHFSPPTRFGTVYRDELRTAPAIDVLLHANVVDLRVNEAGTELRTVHVATLDGHRFVVTARVVVLAAGGVENARLLLAADSQQVRGLGNGSDCVGRFFMEHAEAAVGQILLTDPAAARQLDVVRHRQAVLCLSEASQRAHEVLNVSLQLLEPDHLDASEAGGVPLAIGDTLGRIDGHPAAATTTARAPYARCYIRTEVAPNPESRVTLTYDTDALGMRRPALVWRMGRLESRSIIQTLEVIGAALGSRALGRMLIDIDDSAVRSSLGFPPWAGVHSSMHHMGTTRMSAAPADGVVDANCRVHAISNLYIAGSSVFPAVGFANPTFTIVALALRLADHLAAVLDRG